MNEKYTYAVARVKMRETLLLNDQDLNDLILCKRYDSCLDLLADKGWSINEKTNDYQKILSSQIDEMWEFINELVKDKNDFNVLLYPIDFNNLKAAIKLFITDSEDKSVFSKGGTIERKLIWNAVKEKDFSVLPERLKNVAKNAFEVLLHTKDPQACDAIIDAGLLRAIRDEGYLSSARIIKIYSETFVACADIKIAVRGCLMGKKQKFFHMALVECKSLDISRLALAASKGINEICDYLSGTIYGDAIESIKDSVSEFEKWHNNKALELISSEKNDYFTIASIIAYILKRQNEIRMVRVILASKLARIDEQHIRKRLGRLYA